MEAQAVQTSLNVLAATDFFLKISETVLLYKITFIHHKKYHKDFDKHPIRFKAVLFKPLI